MYDIKNFSTQIKELDIKKRMVAGHFAIFDVKDSDEDIIRRGAFDRSIKERGPDGKDRIMHLLQHSPLKPLGKPLELKEDDVGLFFRSQITDTSFGMDTLKLYRDGVLKEHSIGFNVIQSQFNEEEKATDLTEIKLFEGSTVTWGAQELATGSLVKGICKENELLEKYDTLTKAYYEGDYTDDTFHLLDKQRKYIKELIEKSLNPQPTTPEPEASSLEKLFLSHNTQLKTERIFNGKY